jgi:hypothetical protein
MPATVDPLTDERWKDLVAELRSARPEPPLALRERVLAAAVLPPPPRRRGAAARVLLPVAAAALLAVGVGTALRSLPPAAGDAVRESPADAELRPQQLSGAGGDESAASPGRGIPSDDAEAAPEPFAPGQSGRLQEQHVALGVRVSDVDALSDATARAMEAARSLGGFVVAAHYAVPGPEGGDSTLVVRVPVTRVQEAIARFTRLGTIVSQDVRLQDLQAAYDRRDRELEGLRARIGRLEEQLAAPGLGEQERARLRTQLANARRAVDARVAQQRAAEQQGRLARVELVLTTRSAEDVAVPEDGAAATLRAAAEILGLMLVWLAAALIVAGPFILLAALAIVAARTRRRFAQAHLLERS